MERKNLALLCAGVVCFWLFALAFGTAQGSGLHRQSPAVQTAVQPQGPVQLTAEPPALELPCRAACLIDQQTGTVLYEKNADHPKKSGFQTNLDSWVLLELRCVLHLDLALG